MFLQNLSIRTRLSILASLGIFMMLAAIGYGLYSHHVLSADIVRLAHRNIPLNTSVAEAQRDVLRNWINTLYLTQTTDRTMIELIESDMHKNSAHISEKFDLLKKTFETDEEKGLLDHALLMRKEYTEARDQYLELFRHGKPDDANKFLVNEVRPKLESYIFSLNGLNAQSALEVSTTTDRTETAVMRSRTVYLILGIIGLVGSLWLSRALINSITLPLNWAIYLAGKIAKGNLKNNITKKPQNQDEISRLLNSIADMQEQLRDTASVMQHNAMELSQAALELSQSSTEVANGSRVQNEATTSMAASIEEMTQNIRQLSENTVCTRDTVHHSATLAQQNSQAILQTLAEMQQISVSVTEFAAQLGQLDQQSQQISAVLEVIEGLAGQTNLLALNAAIEAARAGEAGRGFAVVADEVRKLAERTTQSTQEISNTITNIQSSTAQTVQSIRGAVDRVASGMEFASNAGNAAQELHMEAEQVNILVSDISHALQGQSQTSEQIAGNVESIAQMTERNNATVEHISLSAKKLQQLADALDQSTHRFAV